MNNTNKQKAYQSPLATRSAGVLLHVTSLPGKYGIGDLGNEAREFADFLQRSRQRYWQLLPLNLTEQGTGHSPYSSVSSVAGNTLLISPDLLIEEGLLNEQDVSEFTLESDAKVDYQLAENNKDAILERAYENFRKGKSARARNKFLEWTKGQRGWLYDFSLYVALKNYHTNLPWYEWPAEFRDRDKKALTQFAKSRHEDVERVQWLQYIFFQQWNNLKQYCNEKGILLFGDLPFYISYDSCDVWANRDIFSLDRKGKMQLVAGVPPDYFNADGQLWGMPVFRWEVLKKQNYKWWIDRIRKNIELYDLLRLDHFRAFAGYWAVPAQEKTARNGSWKKGPGKDFFEVMRKIFKRLPFVAEDLGDIDDPVYELRDTYGLPGMKVLHFAFGENMPSSDYIPHNYSENFIVYTGTHDNNTTRGWFEKDAGDTEKANLNLYSGEKLKGRTVAPYLIKLAYASVAKCSIVPAQDLLSLGADARMNSPASVKNNWMWRLLPGSLDRSIERWLGEQTIVFNRQQF